jgi:hypothetical protein
MFEAGIRQASRSHCPSSRYQPGDNPATSSGDRGFKAADEAAKAVDFSGQWVHDLVQGIWP